MTHLLVTNDYPPKTGGIQSYLFELWSRLPPAEFAVLTRDYAGAKSFDATLAHRVERVASRMLMPSRALTARIEMLGDELDAGLVVLDPMLPLGLIGRGLSRPYALVLHGAEVTVPVRLPLARDLAARALRSASLLICAGSYPESEVRRLLGSLLPPVARVVPGVDAERFHPLDPAGRAAVRARLGVEADDELVVSVSRLVPRKGMDVLIEAAARLAPSHPRLRVLIGGSGRDAARLERLIARHRAPVRLLGRVSDDELPGLLGASDLFAMCCRDRWLGLEQEGFGIVFVEAAACGVAQLAGRSGGVDDAVADEVSGLMVDRPGDLRRVTEMLGALLDAPERRAELGAAARVRALAEFDYEKLARSLRSELLEHGG